MSPLNPQYIAATFSEYIRAGLHILIWLTIGIAAMATSYVIIRGILVAVQMISHAIGI
jgi:hypothetical protein